MLASRGRHACVTKRPIDGCRKSPPVNLQRGSEEFPLAPPLRVPLLDSPRFGPLERLVKYSDNLRAEKTTNAHALKNICLFFLKRQVAHDFRIKQKKGPRKMVLRLRHFIITSSTPSLVITSGGDIAMVSPIARTIRPPLRASEHILAPTPADAGNGSRVPLSATSSAATMRPLPDSEITVQGSRF
jgi:hypothetical protein